MSQSTPLDSSLCTPRPEWLKSDRACLWLKVATITTLFVTGAGLSFIAGSALFASSSLSSGVNFKAIPPLGAMPLLAVGFLAVAGGVLMIGQMIPIPSCEKRATRLATFIRGAPSKLLALKPPRTERGQKITLALTIGALGVGALLVFYGVSALHASRLLPPPSFLRLKPATAGLLMGMGVVTASGALFALRLLLKRIEKSPPLPRLLPEAKLDKLAEPPLVGNEKDKLQQAQDLLERAEKNWKLLLAASAALFDKKALSDPKLSMLLHHLAWEFVTTGRWEALLRLIELVPACARWTFGKRAQGTTLLHMATKASAVNSDALKVVKALLNAGASPASCDGKGRTCLDRALEGGVGETIACMVEAAQDDLVAKTIVNALGEKDPEKIREQVTRALAILKFAPFWPQRAVSSEERAWLHAATPEGKTLLHLLSRSGSVNLVRLLLSVGASPSDRDEKGRSSLDSALLGGHTETIGVIAHADPRLTLETLEQARSQGEWATVETLLTSAPSFLEKGEPIWFRILVDEAPTETVRAVALAQKEHVVRLLIREARAENWERVKRVVDRDCANELINESATTERKAGSKFCLPPTSLLLVATESAPHGEIVAWLEERGACPDQRLGASSVRNIASLRGHTLTSPTKSREISEEALFFALESKNAQSVRALLTSGATLDCTKQEIPNTSGFDKIDDDADRVLTARALKHKEAARDFLINASPNDDDFWHVAFKLLEWYPSLRGIKDEENNTLDLLALKSKCFWALERLVKTPIYSPKALNASLRVLLFYALSLRSDEETLRMLLKAAPLWPQFKNNEKSLLSCAVSQQNCMAVHVLIEEGAPLDPTCNKKGFEKCAERNLNKGRKEWAEEIHQFLHSSTAKARPPTPHRSRINGSPSLQEAPARGSRTRHGGSIPPLVLHPHRVPPDKRGSLPPPDTPHLPNGKQKSLESAPVSPQAVDTAGFQNAEREEVYPAASSDASDRSE